MGKVYIVHHVDTEGPLYESLEEVFKRLKCIFGIELESSERTLKKLQNREIDLGGMEGEIAITVDLHTISFKSTWGQIDEMLDNIMTKSYRNQLLDSNGNGWVYNWHCMDHVGYKNNPRRRDLGYFKIFDFCTKKIKETNSRRDAIHWHFHPINFFGDAHIPATSYNNSMYYLQQIITRRIIDRNWFPCVNRAGFHSERPDSHMFLEHWIPFDASNQSVDSEKETLFQLDSVDGRFGDWHWAPSDWTIYHPMHDNYQLPGNCKRAIARVLNMKSRLRSISLEEIEKAFEKAMEGVDVYLGITNHDWREMSVEIDEFRGMLQKVVVKHPTVKYYFSDALTAFRSILFKNEDIDKNKIDLHAYVQQRTKGIAKFNVEVTNGALFGPQPWLAIKTKENKYLTDNFDIIIPNIHYSYTFDNQTINLSDIEAIAVASNDKYGYQKICRLFAGNDF